LEIGDFCKKYLNRSIFIFPCPYFDAYGFCISAPGSAQPAPTFFFSNVRVYQVTTCLKGQFVRITTHYLFLEYFQSLRAKKQKPILQGVPELAPQRKQACADNKKDSKLTKINFLLAQITELQSF
jgi:hypothetical protein